MVVSALFSRGFRARTTVQLVREQLDISRAADSGFCSVFTRISVQLVWEQLDISRAVDGGFWQMPAS